MVLQHHLDSSPLADQTLAALWRARARRISGRTIAQCVVLGTLGTIIPLSLGRGTFVALMSLIVAAFGSLRGSNPSVLRRAMASTSWATHYWHYRKRHRRSRRADGRPAVLGAIFGGSIEVMRR